MGPLSGFVSVTPSSHSSSNKTRQKVGLYVYLQTMNYYKVESSTVLRINLDFVIRMYNPNDTSRCVTYFIRVSNSL